MKMSYLKTSMPGGLLLFLLLFGGITETKQEDIVSRKFGVVSDVSIASNMDKLTVENITHKKMRCASLCVELGCSCTSYVYVSSTKTCYMFNKALISGNGDKVAYNKLTECATPRHISNATLQQYTGCNAEYQCDFGYKTSPPDASNEIMCQPDETWAPSIYACVLIPCTSPPPLSNGVPNVTTLSVGGTTTYACDTHYINTGGGLNTRTCVLGGTWAGEINMDCTPIPCDPTVAIANGYVDAPLLSVGSVATHSCDVNYVNTGGTGNTQICVLGGIWSGNVEMVCTLKPCELPIAITNGNVDAPSLSVGSVATYACDSSSINTGGDSSTRICVLGGTWSGIIDMVCSPTRLYKFEITVTIDTASEFYMVVYGEDGSFEFILPSSVPLHTPGTIVVYKETFLGVRALTRSTIGITGGSPFVFEVMLVSITVDGVRYIINDQGDSRYENLPDRNGITTELKPEN